MKCNSLLMIGLLVAAALPAVAAVDRYGEALSEGTENASIAEILSTPDAWVGKQVRIEGEISGVCSHQGCWIDITSPGNATLRVKVDDGVIVFPADALGRTAVAEGTVEILDLERDRYEVWLRHVAEEEGREFDPAEVGDGPYRIVRLRGLGAEISGP